MRMPPTLAPTTSPAFDASRLHGATPLPALGVIRVQGTDAARFLHGQLTQDFALLGLSEARLAAFCSAKGRMLASFVGFKRDHDDILLVCSRDLLPATLKRLSMFVLRAQVKLSDASDAFAVWGVVGASSVALPVRTAHSGCGCIPPRAWHAPCGLPRWVATARRRPKALRWTRRIGSGST